MKAFLIVLVVTALFACILASAGAQDAIDLSTLGKKTAVEPVALPMVSSSMPTASVSPLGGSTNAEVLDLSTLGKKSLKPNMSPAIIKGATPVTITPMFSITNLNITSEANTIFTMPQAVASNASVYTPPIAIYGGS